MNKNDANDFDIELQANDIQAESNVQLPLNFVTCGAVAPDDVKVYIRQSVFKALEKFAKSDTTKELGSILLGDYIEYSGKINIIISDYIEAKYTDASASTLTFTHETWNYLHKIHESNYPSLKILGWQHTHPGYGIFLSNYDMFIQENFFNMPFQTAYVIDPKQNLRGFFQWRNGKVEKLGGFYVYDELGSKINIEAGQEKLQADTKRGSSKLPKVLIALSLVLAVASISLFGVLFSKMSEEAKLRQELEAAIAVQNDEIASQKDFIDTLLDGQQQTIDELDAIIDELKAQLDAIGGEPDGEKVNGIVFKYYTVEKGDTLKGICAKLGIDYNTNLGIIKAVNGITDPNTIVAGQKLLLPTVTIE